MKRNKFSLSHYKLGSCDMGKLYPITWYEVLPGDTIQQATSVFLRFMPMVAPVMTPVRVQIWSFYVPYRLLWDNWENFRTGGPNGLDDHIPPMSDSSNSPIVEGTLQDYLGIPPGYAGLYNELPLRAYFRIWNEYFRDQDLQQENALGLKTNDSGYTVTSGGILPANISWEKDYFTTARPWPQKGTDVTVPVNTPAGTQIAVSSTGRPYFQPVDTNGILEGSSGILPVSLRNIGTAPDGLGGPLQGTFQSDDAGGTINKDLTWKATSLVGVVNTQAGIGNVRLDDLREAMALQRFQEHRAIYGSRYTEFLRYLGVKSSDARLQRPEYLGGTRNVVQFSEVLQTAADGDNPVGTLRGHGIGATKTKRFRRFIEEDGLVMTLMAIRPIALYTQSMYRGFNRTHKEEYWTKELEHVGQQEVKNRELYALSTNPDGVFGYQNQYDDYRQIPSTVCGLFRSTFDYWHLGRIFNNEPVLNESFITGQPSKRIFAEQTQNEILFMASHSIQARRIMSKHGNPIL